MCDLDQSDEETCSDSKLDNEQVNNFVAFTSKVDELDDFKCESDECNEEKTHEELLKSYNLMLEK